MPPCIGLLTVYGEPVGGGYTRKDLSELLWLVSPGDRDGVDMTILNRDVIAWHRLPKAKFIELAVFADATDPQILICSPIGPFTVRDDGDGLDIPAGSLRFTHRFKTDSGHNIDSKADAATTDRWREALTRIAEAPVNVRSKELRAIARVALLME